ncbi:hypothetical protein LZ554_009573 [Drepanopeziza brunnea f. sp. 'monogermtubi']|nr:hypothetical protein LZ554_009573 [Drepanopeziza brunnea f. sp. 'monogermtubi']
MWLTDRPKDVFEAAEECANSNDYRAGSRPGDIHYDNVEEDEDALGVHENRHDDGIFSSALPTFPLTGIDAGTHGIVGMNVPAICTLLRSMKDGHSKTGDDANFKMNMVRKTNTAQTAFLPSTLKCTATIISPSKMLAKTCEVTALVEAVDNVKFMDGETIAVSYCFAHLAENVNGIMINGWVEIL